VHGDLPECQIFSQEDSVAPIALKSQLFLSVAALMWLASPAFAQATGAAPEIYKPANDIEAKAQAVLDKHCARCHQAGKLGKRDKPAKGFGDVLQLQDLVANTRRTLPGNPDGSIIFQVIANKQMPYDLYQEGDFEKPSVTPEDLDALRAWIVAAGESGSTNCKPSDLTYKDIVNTMYQDLGNLPEHRRRNTRYLSLANLQASCATEQEMDVYRQGAVRLLNSLSTNSDPLVLQDNLVGPDKVIVRFNLDDLNWTPELWEEIISHYPYGVRPFDSQYDSLSQTTYTAIPYVRADWLAFFGSRPALYDRILGLPPTYQELEKQVGVDTLDNIRKYLAKRSGFKESGVSQNNRLIERHPISTGYFWTSYDFGGTKTRQNLFEYPLGPKGVFTDSHSYADEFAFEHDGGETIFSLPNGFQAYYLNRADGKSLEKGPTQIVRDIARTDLAVTNGISCMGCHDQGMKNAADEVRDHVVDNRLLPAEAREAVKALYPVKEEMDKIIEQDRKRFLSALERAGLDPKVVHKVDGEPVNALSNRYERDVDIKAVAAEFGVPFDKVETYLRGGGSIGGSFAAQLAQGTVQRDIFETEFANLVESVIDAKFITPASGGFNYKEVKKFETVPTPVSEFKLTLHSDRPTAKVGEAAYFTVTSTKDCYLTLINISGKDEGVVILPNKFTQDNVIKAGQSFNFPTDKDGYDFKFEDRGTETVIALCDVNGNSLPDLKADYSKEDFTSLGRSISVNKRIDNVAAPSKAKNKPGSGGFAAEVARTAIKIKVQ
jgi:mono/diheme cytochrome c family protein